MKVSNVCFCFHAHWWCHITASSAKDWWCHITVEAQADDVNVWCHCTGWLTCFFSLSVCLLQQWETFSERSSSSQTLTQFDSNIAPADPVSQSLSMHGFTINGKTLTLSGSLFLCRSLHGVLSKCSLLHQQWSVCVVIWLVYLLLNITMIVTFSTVTFSSAFAYCDICIHSFMVSALSSCVNMYGAMPLLLNC